MKSTWRIIETTTLSLAILGGLLALSSIGQAAPPTPINSCTTINTPGPYELVADLTSSVTCITINASNVDLKLKGHIITGPSGGSDGTSGILVVAVTHVDINGPGVITNFGRGINFQGVDFSEVKGVTSTGNFFGFTVERDTVNNNPNNLSEQNWFRANTSSGNNQHGFSLNGASENNLVNNIVSNNGAHGILLFDGTGNQVKVNTINGNGGSGIAATNSSGGHTIKDNTANSNNIGIGIAGGSTGNSVKGNTAQNNVFDMVDDNTNCDNNIWRDNIFNITNQTCIQ